jgi:23S rRNA pseudouridine2605 synthase
MRINQYIASATGLSRRAADTAVTEGRITINGQTAALGQTVAPTDAVSLDGLPLVPKTAHTYLMLNKPAGYVSSRVQQDTNPTIYELLPPEYHTLRPGGRLDLESSGLMLLSDDGAFIQTITHPSHDKTKVYELTLERALSTLDSSKLEKGVQLTDGPSRVKALEMHGRNVTVSLNEGRNRQLRRTFGALGYTVERLHSTSVGTYQLGALPPGQYATFTPVIV